MLKDDELDSEIYEQKLQLLNRKLLSIAEKECGEIQIHYLSSKTKSTICQKVWLRFSQKHNKSPTRLNNNVQKCYTGVRKRAFSTSDNSCQFHRSNNSENTTRQTSVVTFIRQNDKIFSPQIFNLIKSSVFFTFFILKAILIISVTLLILYCAIFLHKPTQTFISRNTQDLIHPFMRALRIFTLPIVRHFPTFTNLYEEPCLISNPFFATDFDCWPCETVRHIPDLTGFSNFSLFYHHSGIPFVVKDAFKFTIEIKDLKRIFLKSPDILSKLVNLNSITTTTIGRLFDTEEGILNETDLHVAWKINRVTVARLLRDYFPKPYFIPATTEVSVQHYLFLDNQKSQSHTLPITEFANVYLTQASGSRRLVLIPTENCQRKCRIVSRILYPKDVLFYNWLFWRPMSVPVESSIFKTNTSVTYIGSFY